MATLVTGASGFIGFKLTEMLIQEGVSVIGFDNFISENLSRLQAGTDKLEIAKGDVSLLPEVMNVVKGRSIDTIFHLAARTSVPSEENPWLTYRSNVEGTYNIFETARLFDVKKVIFTSSIASYGLSLPKVVTDETIQRPVLWYGVTKLFGELQGRFYERKFGIDFRGIRYCQVLGPGVTAPGVSQCIPWMIEAAAQNRAFKVWLREDDVMPLVYYKDAVKCLYLLSVAPKERVKTQIYNVGSILPVPTIGELADAVKKYVPAADITFEPDPAIGEFIKALPKMFDDRPLREEIGYKPEYGLEATVKSFVDEVRDKMAPKRT